MQPAAGPRLPATSHEAAFAAGEPHLQLSGSQRFHTLPPPPLQVDRPYHVRVLVPCYSEPLEIVGATVTAALKAFLPAGVQRTLYLCDDGKDSTKRKW